MRALEVVPKLLDGGAHAARRAAGGRYFERAPSGRLRLSAAVLRDLFMRCAYIAPQLSTYAAIERLCVSSLSKA